MREKLMRRFIFGWRERVKWRRVVAARVTRVRTETVTSWEMWLVIGEVWGEVDALDVRVGTSMGHRNPPF